MVDEAPIGKRAMEQLALGGFDVVLTDLMMPGMSGEELLAAVRQTYPASQVVLLTAHGTIDSAVKATKSGAFEYLTKPTDRETLVMTVGKAAEFANLAAGEPSCCARGWRANSRSRASSGSIRRSRK